MPTIGIITVPIQDEKKTPELKGDQYVLECNSNYMKQGGSNVVAIPYDIEPEALYALLDQINGVLFTGGNIIMTPDHSYYHTAKRIYQYCMDKKDKFGEDFPILATCQGFQIVALFASGDDFSIMEDIVVNRIRKVIWKDKNSEMWKGFSESLKEKMEQQDSA